MPDTKKIRVGESGKLKTPEILRPSADSLLDICSRNVAEFIPFQYIEERYQCRIPEPVQERIIYWSFPRHESDICRYSSLSRVPAAVLSSSDDTVHNNLPAIDIQRSEYEQGLSVSSTSASSIVPSSRNFADDTRDPRRQPDGSKGHKSQHPFYRGIKLLEQGCVHNVLQVGFHLSGDISSGYSSSSTQTITTQINNPTESNSASPGTGNVSALSALQERSRGISANNSRSIESSGRTAANVGDDAESTVKKYKVSLSFDRCKITKVSCSCDTKDIFWCQHVVALSLYRIRYPKNVNLRIPISETLLQMDRQQLQKFAQYLIAKHHTEVLPTAQKLADTILKGGDDIDINRIAGAPDPTAGGNGTTDDNVWHLDENEAKEQIKEYLAQQNVSFYSANKHLGSMFSKVRELLRVNDANGVRLLAIITDQFVDDPKLVIWKAQETPMTDKCRYLWDQLGALWVSVVLDPTTTLRRHSVLSDNETRKSGNLNLQKSNRRQSRQWRDDNQILFLKKCLKNWSRVKVCPLEDPDIHWSSSEINESNSHNQQHSSNQVSSSDEDSDNDSSLYQTSSCNNALPLPSRSDCSRVKQLGNEEDQSSDARTRTEDLIHSENEILEAGESGNDKPKKRKRLTKRVNCKRYRKDYCRRFLKPRTIFHKALDALNMSWADSLLINILQNGEIPCSSYVCNPNGKAMFYKGLNYLTWDEHLPTACARVEALRINGYCEEAVRLAVAIVRSMKQKQQKAYNDWNSRKLKHGETKGIASACEAEKSESEKCCSGKISEGILANCSVSMPHVKVKSWEGWIGHSLNPIGCLFETLVDANRTCLEKGQKHKEQCHKETRKQNSDQELIQKTNQTSIVCSSSNLQSHSRKNDIAASKLPSNSTNTSGKDVSSTSSNNMIDKSKSYPPETLLSLAVEAAIIGLGQQRTMPPGLYAQEKSCKQEERIIHRLQEITSSPTSSCDKKLLLSTIRYQAYLLLKMGSKSGFGKTVHRESVPMQTFAKYLFGVLFPYDRELAFKIGLRAMRLPILEEIDLSTLSHNRNITLENQHGHYNNVGNEQYGVGRNRHNSNRNRHRRSGDIGGINNEPEQLRRNGVGNLTARMPRWYTLGHIEGEQCILASTMLYAAKGEGKQLDRILIASQRHIHSSTNIFKLAQDAFRYALPVTPTQAQIPPSSEQRNDNRETEREQTTHGCCQEHSVRTNTSNGKDHKICDNGNKELLKVSFELGIQVMRMTLTSLNWKRREMVSWLVTCAIELGPNAVLRILQSWNRLFTPTEATSIVANTIINSQSTVLPGYKQSCVDCCTAAAAQTSYYYHRNCQQQQPVDFTKQENIIASVRALALQCAHEDPSNCALNALTLCESEPYAFETAYQIVIDCARTQITSGGLREFSQLRGEDGASTFSYGQSASIHASPMTSSQLFTVSRYMEQRGYPQRAFKLALLAVASVQLAHNQDNHPAVNDIHWACQLSISLQSSDASSTELSALIPLIVKNISCATVLSDVLRRCTSKISCKDPSNSGLKPLQPLTKTPFSQSLDACISYERSPLKLLLEATITAFITTTHSRLSSISPRHYTEFIDFLTKAKETFMLSKDGPMQFAQLVENMKMAYKGKKKLVGLLKDRFG